MLDSFKKGNNLPENLIPKFLWRPLKKHFRNQQNLIRLARAERAVASFKVPRAKAHGLPGPLVVSLTSYPPRYTMLAKTLKSLLMQNVKPDHLILWLAVGTESSLPDDVLALQANGLEIRYCDELWSYKKIIPALETFPEAYIVTADDDLYYDKKWLKTIVQGVDSEKPVIVCRRAHRPVLRKGELAPYGDWEHDVVTSGAIDDCIFPTSGAGALYPPGSLSLEVFDRDVFMSVCRFADDVWLFVMALRRGSKFRQVGGGFAQIAWDSAPSTSLLHHNITGGGNDRQLAAVLEHYGSSDLISAREFNE